MEIQKLGETIRLRSQLLIAPKAISNSSYKDMFLSYSIRDGW